MTDYSSVARPAMPFIQQRFSGIPSSNLFGAAPVDNESHTSLEAPAGPAVAHTCPQHSYTHQIQLQPSPLPPQSPASHHQALPLQSHAGPVPYPAEVMCSKLVGMPAVATIPVGAAPYLPPQTYHHQVYTQMVPLPTCQYRYHIVPHYPVYSSDGYPDSRFYQPCPNHLPPVHSTYHPPYQHPSHPPARDVRVPVQQQYPEQGGPGQGPGGPDKGHQDSAATPPQQYAQQPHQQNGQQMYPPSDAAAPNAAPQWHLAGPQEGKSRAAAGSAFPLNETKPINPAKDVKATNEGPRDEPQRCEADPPGSTPSSSPQSARIRAAMKKKISSKTSPGNDKTMNQPEPGSDPGSGSGSGGNETAPEERPRKQRKPYTITRHREVWTDEEHARFVQALRLYDRDWKRIEQYIGTKRVLQIRSHAQKYFGKVMRYNTGEYVPPPRPKRKASAPYPRNSKRDKGRDQNGTGSTANRKKQSSTAWQLVPVSSEQMANSSGEEKASTVNVHRDVEVPRADERPEPDSQGQNVVKNAQKSAQEMHAELHRPRQSQAAGFPPGPAPEHAGCGHMQGTQGASCVYPYYNGGWQAVQQHGPTTGASGASPLMLLSREAAMASRAPASGWRSAAASRRARRAQILRERKSSASSSPVATAGANDRAVGRSNRSDGSDGSGGSGRSGESGGSGGSDGSDGSDDGMAGLSGSDRPGLSDIGGGSGESEEGIPELDTLDMEGRNGGRDYGERTEDDPSSSHDGSGSDGRRSVSVDPASGPSRENTPPENGSGNEGGSRGSIYRDDELDERRRFEGLNSRKTEYENGREGEKVAKIERTNLSASGREKDGAYYEESIEEDYKKRKGGKEKAAEGLLERKRARNEQVGDCDEKTQTEPAQQRLKQNNVLG